MLKPYTNFSSTFCYVNICEYFVHIFADMASLSGHGDITKVGAHFHLLI